MRVPLVPTDLAELARDRHGVLHAADLRAAGVDERGRRRLMDVGWLERAAPHVYRTAGSPDTWRQRLQIGVAALRPDGFVSHMAAAALHRLDRADPSAVEFLVPRGRRSRLEWPVHTSGLFEPIDRVVVDGLPATSATRTIIDLAQGGHPRTTVEAAMDSAVRLGLSHPEVIARRLETLRGSGRAWCRLVDRLLPDAGGHSPLERRFLRLCRSAGLQRPRTQVVIRDRRGRHVARVDFLFGEQLVVEVTGRLGHVSDAERSRDAQRRNELQALGFTVVEFTSQQVFHQPQRVATDLRRHLP